MLASWANPVTFGEHNRGVVLLGVVLVRCIGHDGVDVDVLFAFGGTLLGFREDEQLETGLLKLLAGDFQVAARVCSGEVGLAADEFIARSGAQSERCLEREDAEDGIPETFLGDYAVAVSVEHVAEAFRGVAEVEEHVAAGGDRGGDEVLRFIACVIPIIIDASVRMRPLKPSSSRRGSLSSSGARVAGRISLSAMPERNRRDSSGAPMWPIMID
jgi:hypothetical protein